MKLELTDRIRGKNGTVIARNTGESKPDGNNLADLMPVDLMTVQDTEDDPDNHEFFGGDERPKIACVACKSDLVKPNGLARRVCAQHATCCDTAACANCGAFVALGLCHCCGQHVCMCDNNETECGESPREYQCDKHFWPPESDGFVDSATQQLMDEDDDRSFFNEKLDNLRNER